MVLIVVFFCSRFLDLIMVFWDKNIKLYGITVLVKVWMRLMDVSNFSKFSYVKEIFNLLVIYLNRQ